jgi:hypothetical protein
MDNSKLARLTLWFVILVTLGHSQAFAMQSRDTRNDGPPECTFVDGWQQLRGPEDPSHPAAARNLQIGGRNSTLAEAWVPPGRLYVGGMFGVYQSEDCGVNWSQIFGSLPPVDSAYYVQAIVSDLTGRLFLSYVTISGTSLRISNDGGATWADAPVRFGLVTQGGLSSSGGHRLFARAQGGTLVGGPYAFAYTDDGGQTWSVMWHQLGPEKFTSDPTDPDVLYSVDLYPSDLAASRASQAGYALRRSVDRGASFQYWSRVEEQPGALAASVDASRFWFASYGQHLWQSRDSGQSWQILDTMPFQDPRQLAVSPHDPRILYAVSGDGYIWVYREPDPTP